MTASSTVDPDLAGLATAHVARLESIDPLLGLAAEMGDATGDGEMIRVPGACGWSRIVDVDPASAAAPYGRLRQYILTVRWAGDPRALDALLVAWVDWAQRAGVRDAGPDTQMSVTWPSRDVAASRVFLAHGLIPDRTVGVRRGGRPTRPSKPERAIVRRADSTDAAVIVALTNEELRYETGLNVCGERPGHDEQRRAELGRLLGGERPPWAWVAEREGQVIGALVAFRPEASRWMLPLTSLSPACYLGLTCVTAAARGSGAGHALVAAAHTEFADAGVAASLLHYGTLNPLSAPFWARAGYRPLWSVWTAHPAHTAR